MTATSTTGRPRRAKAPDAQCAAAVDLARAAAEEEAGPAAVGDHLGVEAEGDRVVTHRFAALSPAYVGWHWAVTVARASRAKAVTVDEVVLLPGGEALLAPAWVPWSERLRPGDLRPGYLLPTSEDDPRLEPGYAHLLLAPPVEGDLDPDEDAAVAWEIGLGRTRVLSRIGRDDAVDRWRSGDRGPDAPLAEAAPAQCSTCGFYLQLSGSLRRVLGVCANEYSPEDGRVVTADHGCGAHSEAAVLPATPEVAPPVIDTMGYDVMEVRSPGPDQEPEQEPHGSVDESEPAEELGHS